MDTYIKTPESISFSVLANKNYTLSPSVYKTLCIPNPNLKPLREFLSRPLNGSDLGQDVGSINYIKHSTHFFMRTKALQSYSYIPEFNSESLVPIFPCAFTQIDLKEGDMIISKDSNIGEIIVLDNDYPNICLSGALYRLPIDKYKYYVLAFVKHPIFREQLNYVVPKGATIRHAKTSFLDCLIPFPNLSTNETISYIENLTKAIVVLEKNIKEKYANFISIINDEITNNQKYNSFSFSFPSFSELSANSRLDAKFYSPIFKETDFFIRNYKYGTKSIKELGFKMSRGQNLQVSNIGKSVYSSKRHTNFYTLVLPKFLSVYGTSNKVEYLGNPNKLKILQKGDLIFGAEGFEKGRSIVVIEDMDNYITNIHGITITHSLGLNLNESIFLKCFLDYLRSKGMIEAFAVGGNGGSFAQRYWDFLRVPNFPDSIKQRIVNLYYAGIDYKSPQLECHNLDDFNVALLRFVNSSGIFELHKLKSIFQKTIDLAIQSIIEDKEVKVEYNLFMRCGIATALS